MKLMSALFLIATMISLTACSLPVSIDADCAWAKPIRFSELTKNWLSTLSPWPEPVRQDFEKIAKHNDKHRAFCG